MADITSYATQYLPKVNWGSVGNFLWWGLIFLLFVLVLGAVFGLWVWWYMNKKAYKYTIVIFEKVDGRYKNNSKDKAMERKLGTGGDTIFYLQKLKKIVPRPTIQTGANTFWFVKREDGELINIGMEDIDMKMKEVGVYYLENEMRYARASLQKLNKDRNLQESFWAKYGRDILTIIFIIVVSMMLLLIASKLMQIVGSIDGLIQSSKAVMDKGGEVLGAVDRVCGSTGLTVPPLNYTGN